MPSARNVSHLVESARPLVNRLAEDEELKQSLRSALGSAQRVYAGLNEQPSRRDAAVKLVGDADLRNNLQHALSELRFASERARQPPPRSGHKTFLAVGAIAAFALLNPVTGPPLRAKLSGLFSSRSSSELDFGD